MYTSPKLTVDGICINHDEILLINRKHMPFQGRWALPGGFVEYGETTEKAVCREVREETGLETEIVSLFGVYSDPSRDPRGHTVSVIYTLRKIGGSLQGGDDAGDARFFPIQKLPELAFDHIQIISDFKRRNNDVLPKM
jgi:8-oxo-dGTP diphosphatase